MAEQCKKIKIILCFILILTGLCFGKDFLSKYIAESDEDVEVIKEPWKYLFESDCYIRRIYFKNKKTGKITTNGDNTDMFKSYRTKNEWQLSPIVYIGEWEYDDQIGRTIRLIRRQNFGDGYLNSTYETKDEINERIPAMDWNLIRTINDVLNFDNSPRQFLQRLNYEEEERLVDKLVQNGYFIISRFYTSWEEWENNYGVKELKDTDPYKVEANEKLHPRQNIERKYMTIEEQKELEKIRDIREGKEREERLKKYTELKMIWEEKMAEEEKKRKWWQRKRKKEWWEGHAIWA